MAIRPLVIPQFQAGRAIVDAEGRPQTDFLRALNQLGAIVQQIYELPDIQAAIVAAQTAANNAQTAANNANSAASASAAESSIVSSFVKSFAGASPLEAAVGGNVTVKNHTRQYGNTTLNPDRTITGAVVTTGAAAGAEVHIYYDDATRVNATPTFVSTTTQPVQGGNRHVIGSVIIPAAGTSDGGYVRPPGYTGPTP